MITREISVINQCLMNDQVLFYGSHGVVEESNRKETRNRDDRAPCLEAD